MLPLLQATKLAEKIAAELQPFCERVAIAGSIRRRREFVNDIDIVCLPLENKFAALRERVLRSTAVVTDGSQTIVTRMTNGVQLDCWIAKRPEQDLLTSTPTNFGSLLLCRTGSKEHNIYLVEHAKRIRDGLGGFLRWNPYHGVFDSRGDCLASVTEEDIFRVLQLDFVPPEKRER